MINYNETRAHSLFVLFVRLVFNEPTQIGNFVTG